MRASARSAHSPQPRRSMPTAGRLRLARRPRWPLQRRRQRRVSRRSRSPSRLRTRPPRSSRPARAHRRRRTRPRTAPRPSPGRPPTTPDSTSPVPAVASAGLPPALTATKDAPASTTSVSSPFSTTVAPLRRGGLASRSRACAPRPAPTRLPSRRASSPACGVSTVGRRGRTARSISPPGQRVQAVGVDQQRALELADQPPRQLQRLVLPARARGPARRRRRARPPPAPPPRRRAADARPGPPAAPSSPRSASARRSTLSEAGTAARTQPAPARIAASHAMQTAPVNPVEPPTDEHRAGAELGRVDRPREEPGRAPTARISPASKATGAAIRDADVDHLDPARVAPCPAAPRARAWRRGR